MTLRDLYKKHHWQTAGPTFYQLHLLFDKHAEEQNELVDVLAERVQSLGGIAVGDPRHAAELTTIPRPPDGAEEVGVMIDRTLRAHETIITKVRKGIVTFAFLTGLLLIPAARVDRPGTAVALIINGFAKEVMNQLPMEFAVEAQKLLGVSLEGSVG